jgi:GrpB-like predicted nucleotidyltransferase (UPF0157 family)
VLGLQATRVGIGARRECQRRGDPASRDRRRQQRQQEVVLAGEDPDGEPDPEDNQRDCIHAGVEEAQVELTLGDFLRRHPEAVKDPAAHTHPPE